MYCSRASLRVNSPNPNHCPGALLAVLFVLQGPSAVHHCFSFSLLFAINRDEVRAQLGSRLESHDNARYGGV